MGVIWFAVNRSRLKISTTLLGLSLILLSPSCGKNPTAKISALPTDTPRDPENAPTQPTTNAPSGSSSTHNPDSSRLAPPPKNEPFPVPNGSRLIPDTVPQIEKYLLDEINNSRRSHQLPPLKMQDELTSYARAYSEEISQTGHFTHESPTSGGLPQRLRAVHGQFSSLSENLAKATSPEDIHPGLMASPGHRANILSPDHDVVGIGVVIDRVKNERNLFVTQIFGTTRQPIDLTRVRTQFLTQLNSQRTRLQLPLLEENDLLNREAELSTTTCFANDVTKNTRPRKPTGFQQITQISFIATNPLEAISEIPGLTGARAAFVGIGMRKGEDLSHQGTVCVVVVLGRP